MKSNNYFNKTMMAAITNIDLTVELCLSIKASKEKEWFNYKVEIFLLIKGYRERLENISLVNDDTLYLDAYYEPELPLFVEGIKGVIAEKSDFFSFTPVDERDFIFELSKTNKEGNYFLSFLVDKNIPSVWEGIRMIVSKCALIEFTDNILQETIILER